MPFPQALRSLWSLMRRLSLDLFSVRAAECALQWDAYDARVALALTPLALLGLVAAGYAAALAYVRAFKGDRRAWRDEQRGRRRGGVHVGGRDGRGRQQQHRWLRSRSRSGSGRDDDE